MTAATSTDRTGQRVALDCLRTALAQETGVLARWPELTWQQVYSRAPELCESELERRSSAGPHWLRRLSTSGQADALVGRFDRHVDIGILRSCAFSPDATMVASAGGDGVRVWDVKGLHERSHMRRGKWVRARDCAFPTGRNVLLTCWDDGGIAEYDTGDWHLAREFEGVARPVLLIALNEDASHLAVLGAGEGDSEESDEGEIAVFDLDDGTRMAWLTIDGRQPGSIAFVPGQETLLWTSGVDEEPLAWRYIEDPEPEVVEFAWGATESGVSRVCLSADGERRVVAGGDIALLQESGDDDWSEVADLNDSPELLDVQRLGGTSRLVCAFSPAEPIAVLAGSNGAIQVWDTECGEHLATLGGGAAAVTHLCFSDDGRYIASTSADDYVTVWDSAAAVAVGVDESAWTGSVFDSALSPDGEHLVLAGRQPQATVYVLEPETLEPRDIRYVPDDPDITVGGIGAVAVSPSGERIVLGAADGSGTQLVWMDGGREQVDISEQKWPTVSASWSPDGSLVAWVTRNSDDSDEAESEIVVCDAETGELVGYHSGFGLAVGCRFVSGGDEIVALYSQSAEFVSPEDPDQQDRYDTGGHSHGGGWGSFVACDTAASIAAFAHSSGEIDLVDTSSGSLRCRWSLAGLLKGTWSPELSAVSVSADGELVAAATKLGVLAVAPVGAEKPTAFFPIMSELAGCHFHSDGKRIVCVERGGAFHAFELMGSGLPFVEAPNPAAILTKARDCAVAGDYDAAIELVQRALEEVRSQSRGDLEVDCWQLRAEIMTATSAAATLGDTPPLQEAVPPADMALSARICPHCAWAVSEADVWCPHCGRDL